MTGPTPPSPEALVALLTELDRVRALTLDLLERNTPTFPPPPLDDAGAERTSRDLLIGARRAVLGNPVAARAMYDLLVAEGRRYAATAEGAALRDSLVASPAVDHLRRIWDTVSLNVLGGPASPSTVPDAWAELLADTVAGRGIDDALLARLRPEGFA
jgi:hypothetical protein